jgi:peptidoglycan/xylan/chitin deacetylase (PgdA/CDA1 family)
MTWDMVDTMHRSGIITIGSHTASHCLLPSETMETAQAELVSSKQTLETRLGSKVTHFAYPDGRFNPPVVQAVKSAGYRFAFGICQSRDSKSPLLTIPRKVLWERSSVNALGNFSPSIMNCQANWAFDHKSRCEHEHDIVPLFEGDSASGGVAASAAGRSQRTFEPKASEAGHGTID